MDPRFIHQYVLAREITLPLPIFPFPEAPQLGFVAGLSF